MEKQLIPATGRQREALQGLLDPVWWPQLATLTRGGAGRLINTLRSDWRQQPATRLQERFLKHHLAWTGGMTGGEAADRIAALRQRAATVPPSQKEVAADHE